MKYKNKVCNIAGVLYQPKPFGSKDFKCLKLREFKWCNSEYCQLI